MEFIFTENRQSSKNILCSVTDSLSWLYEMRKIIIQCENGHVEIWFEIDPMPFFVQNVFLRKVEMGDIRVKEFSLKPYRHHMKRRSINVNRER